MFSFTTAPRVDGIGPVLIVPIMATTVSQIVEEAQAAVAAGASALEWRVDALLGSHTDVNVADIVAEVCSQLDPLDIPLILTVRTAGQGGLFDPAPARYGLLIATLLDGVRRVPGTNSWIAVDIERSHPSSLRLAEQVADAGFLPIVSSHNWVNTPHVDDIVLALLEVAESFPGVIKLATTAQTPMDAERLLQATRSVVNETGREVITMAMGETGRRSRIEGWKYGCVATFVTNGTASAPGQVPIEEIRALLVAEKNQPSALSEGLVGEVSAGDGHLGEGREA